MTSRPKCFNCGNHAGENGFAQALVKIYSNEEETAEIVDNKINPSYRTKKRWCCINCLLTTVASGSFQDALDYEQVFSQE